LSTARSFVAESEHTEAEQALVIYERLGDRMGMIRALIQLGNSHNAQGAYETAATHYERGLALSREIDDRQTEASCMINLAVIAKRHQEYEESRQLSERSLALGEPDKARGCLKQSLIIAHDIDSGLLLMLVLVGIAHYIAEIGEPERSVAFLTLVYQHPASNQQTRDEARLLLQTVAPELSAGKMGVNPAPVSDLTQIVTELLAEL
jgi:tetratricopeptide (TPR) repeat protein